MSYKVGITVGLCLGLLACATVPSSGIGALAGQWVMANGPAAGRVYRATVEQDQLVVSTLEKTPCLRANEKAFFGKQIGNQLQGKAYVCLSGGNQTVRDLVMSVQDEDTLIARVANSDMPDIRFERVK